MRTLVILTLLAMLASQALAQDFSLLDSAMSQLQLRASDIHFDQDEMATWGGDAMRLSYFTMFHRNPLKLPKYGRMNLESFAADCGNISALVANAGRKIDCPVRRGLISDALEPYYRKLDSLPATRLSNRMKVLQGDKLDALRKKVDLFYSVIDDRESYFNIVFHDTATSERRRQIFHYFVADSQKYNDTIEALAKSVDFNRLIAGAEDMSETIKRLADSIEFLGFPTERTEIKTDNGLIVIGTSGNDKFRYTVPPLLILDPAGDDRYEISGFLGQAALSVIIDARGNDYYNSADTTLPGIGGAIFGMTAVVDKAGDDLYESKNVAQGCGIFGVGVLMDLGGNDNYRCKSNAQGCGIFGVGILADSTGNDSLYCWSNAQGYGYTKGCGFCINYSGNDVYIAEDSILFSPGQQTQEHNSSLAQGVGFGKRADFVDGHSWAGGVGILCDVMGDDRYSAGLFAQGCGYWFALGMLLDGAGNDDYYSVWYTLGSGAHYAIGYLDDFAGNDRYNATMNMSIGSGHDFTIGYFNEREGNDIYLAPGLSLGGGNFQGIGIFHDWKGDDSYTTSGGFILGGARGLEQGARAYLNTFGVYVDGGGKDDYKEKRVSNNSRWISTKPDSAKVTPFEIGVGIDKD